MKNFQVWLVLEETEDDSPQHQLETFQLSVCQSEEEGRASFEAAQHCLSNYKMDFAKEENQMPKLKWGTKVRTTQKAIDRQIFTKHRRGICLGGSKYYIVVVCEGQVTPGRYHPSFWVETS